MENFLFKQIEAWLVILVLMVILPLSGLWVFAVTKHHVFPYAIIKEVSDFAKGDPMGQSTLLERVQGTTNPLSVWQRDYDISLTSSYKKVALEGQSPDRESPVLFMKGPQPDYRVLVGVFALQDSVWGALLIDGGGNIRHQWSLSGNDLRDENGPDGNLYGVAVLPDGSIMYNKQELGKGIIRRDYCSEILWVNEGLYHHVVALDGEKKTLWTFGRGQKAAFPTLVNIDVEDGKTLKTIKMEDVYRANPNLHIFDHRTKQKITNMPHPNDIEVLSGDLARYFPMFEEGDLAINYHMNSLVFVVDPDSLKVKFWYQGAGDGAHDVDFQKDGTLTIFNNNYRKSWAGHEHKNFSEIIAISTVEHKHRVITSGEKAAIYSRINGHHQFNGEDRIMFSSSTQGRFTEVAKDTGEIFFDFVNVYEKKSKKALHVSESFQFSKQEFPVANKSCN